MSKIEIESQKEHTDEHKASSIGSPCDEHSDLLTEQQIILTRGDSMTDDGLMRLPSDKELIVRQEDIELTRAGASYLSDAETLKEIADWEAQKGSLGDLLAKGLMTGEKITHEEILAIHTTKQRIHRDSHQARGRYNDFLDGFGDKVGLAEIIRKAIQEAYDSNSATKELDPKNEKLNANFRQLWSHDQRWICQAPKDGGGACEKPFAILKEYRQSPDPIHLSCPWCEQEGRDTTTPDLRKVGDLIAFSRTARATLDCILRACIGNEFPDSASYLEVESCEDESYVGKRLTIGTVLGSRDRNISSSYIQSIQSVLPSGKSIDLKTEDGHRITLVRKGVSDEYRYFGINTDIVRRISNKLVSESGDGIVPIDAFPSSEKARMWAQDLAAQILYAIDSRASKTIATVVSTQTARNKGLATEANSNMYVLTKEVTEQLDEAFQQINGKNEMAEFFRESMLPPMICPPEDWKESEDESELDTKSFKGGYITKEMQEKRPLISKEAHHVQTKDEGGKSQHRFIPSADDIDALNQLQSTKWVTDESMHEIIRDTIDKEVRHRLLHRVRIRPTTYTDLRMTIKQRRALKIEEAKNEFPKLTDEEIESLVNRELPLVKDKPGMISAIGDDMTKSRAIDEMKKHLDPTKHDEIFATAIDWNKLAEALIPNECDECDESGKGSDGENCGVCSGSKGYNQDTHLVKGKHRLNSKGKIFLGHVNSDALVAYNTLLSLVDMENRVSFDVISPEENVLGVPDRQQVKEWLDLVKQSEAFLGLIDDGDNSIFKCPHFYHSWYMDWRGRCYTGTKMLSPQDDDVSRGLLRFAETRKLTEEGWKWLSLYTASLWKGRGIPDDPNTKERGKLLEWSQQKSFREALQNVANDPMNDDNYNLWASSDVLRSKSEGFLRLSATFAFCKALDEGQGSGDITDKECGVGAPCNLPVVHDASSNIYQHMAMLTRDKQMAMNVNVLPAAKWFEEKGTTVETLKTHLKEAGLPVSGKKDDLIARLRDADKEPQLPADIYRKIAEEVKKYWMRLIDNGKNPFTDMGFKEDDFDLDNEDGFLSLMTSRSMAKNPVMTMGYGSGRLAMIESLLTHNGDSRPSGRVRWLPFSDQFYAVSEGIEVTASAEAEGDKPADKLTWSICAHPTSILAQYIGDREDIHPRYHEAIAEEIVRAYRKAVNKCLPGALVTKNLLSQTLDISRKTKQLEAIRNKFIWSHYSTDEEKETATANGIETPHKTPSPEKATKEEQATKEAFARCKKEYAKIFKPRGRKPAKLRLKSKHEKDEDLVAHIDEINSLRAKTNPITWTLLDGPTVRNICLEEGEFDTVKPWIPTVSVGDKKTESVQRAIGKMKKQLQLPEANLGEIFLETYDSKDADGWINRTALCEAIMTSSGLKFNAKIHVYNKLLTAAARMHLSDDVLDAYDTLLSRTASTFSKFTPGTRYDVQKEKLGLAPNFIHSIDSAHLRRVMNELSVLQQKAGFAPQLWAVHDAFGAHPNDIEEMRNIVLRQFVAIHGDIDDDNTTAHGLLHRVCLDHGVDAEKIVEGELDLDEVLNNGEGYLIG